MNHLATLADLHRVGRYDRMSDVVALTWQTPLSMQEFVRKKATRSPIRAKRPEWLCIQENVTLTQMNAEVGRKSLYVLQDRRH
jgi:hypothetical protein